MRCLFDSADRRRHRAHDRPAACADVRERGQAGSAHIGLGRFRAMKKLFELLVCFLHPLAVVLMWLDLATRPDMARGWKLAWAILGLIPLVPFIYVLTGGDLW
jgi:uncharacterized membrane protein YhaH (DUF805 family)